MNVSASEQQPVVRVRGLHQYYGATHIIRGVDLDLYRGQVIVIMGPSGGGKTTFLRCLNFLEPSAAGSIEVAGIRVEAAASRDKWRADIRTIRRRAAMVFQDFNLFPHKSVLENIIEGATKVKQVPKAEAIACAEKELGRKGLLARRDDYPARLATGEQQWVAIARSLCMEPDVLLFDDPTSALDPELIGELADTIKRLAGEGTGIIIVTNEPYLARHVADQVVFMADGLWTEQAPPQAFFANPQQERTRRFLDQITLKGIAVDG